MIIVLQAIQDYEEQKITLEDLQDIIWGLSENTIESLPSYQIEYYLLK